MSDDGLKFYCDKPECIAHGLRAMKKKQIAARQPEGQVK